MALEATLCDVLTRHDDTVFGHWDYISRQVVASPFKPVDYMDRIDIFGYIVMVNVSLAGDILIQTVNLLHFRQGCQRGHIADLGLSAGKHS